MRFVVITGLSGAGKTTARQAFEEFGYFCSDNLPPQLYLPTLELCRSHGVENIAVVTDARTLGFLPGFDAALQEVAKHVKPEVVFLEAIDDVLLKRYGLTRRSHPMQESNLLSDVQEERRVLAPLRLAADVTIDTTDLSSRALVDRLRQVFGSGEAFQVRLFSFGFKHGAPRDADLVIDVRGLPNPFYDEGLRPLSGLAPEVRDYVFTPESVAFFDQVKRFVGASLEMAKRAGRNNYNVAVGCTGGRHRSVAITEALARDLQSEWAVSHEHRDIEKGEGGP